MAVRERPTLHGRRFQARLWPTLLMLVLVPLLLGLGVWQLDRAAQKRQLLAERAARQAAPALPVGELAADPRAEGRRVELFGHFDRQHTLLLAHRSRHGQPGVEVLQPFLDQPSGMWVLVNRGWLAWPNPAKRQTPPTPSGLLKLSTWVHSPRTLGRASPERPAEGWPRLVYQVDPPELWALLGRSGVGYELRQTSGPGRFDSQWPAHSLRPAQHVAYALQWFALAVAVVGLWLFHGFHDRARGLGHDPPGPLLERR